MTEFVFKGNNLLIFDYKYLDIMGIEVPGLITLRAGYRESKPLKGTRAKADKDIIPGSQCMEITRRGICTLISPTKPIYQCVAAYGYFGRSPDTDGESIWGHTNLNNTLKMII